MPAKLSVVISSLNGADGVERCLHALAAQTISSQLELIVVDDGSTDATSDVGRSHAVVVIRHPANRGLAAARNSGLQAATAPVVAFLDDDCEPEPVWAEQLLSAYAEGVMGAGGPILPAADNAFMLGYLQRNNPLKPQESDLAKSNRAAYRLKLYLKRQWAPAPELADRDVYSFAGANMSFVREALIEVGQFDERFRFGGEDLDMCMRMRRAFPSGRLAFAPKARITHHFKSAVSDTLRRSRAYGRGSARLYRKWPDMPPTFFPGPLLVLGVLLLSVRDRRLAPFLAAVPHLLYPRGLSVAVTNRTSASLLDPYLQLAQETCGNVGFLQGLWIFRQLAPETRDEALRAADSSAPPEPVT